MKNWIAAVVVIISVLILTRSDVRLNLDDKQVAIGSTCAHSTPIEDYCEEFFFGKPFPKMKINQTGLVKLCQTQQHDGFVGPAVYATLFSITDRIPVYSADVLTLYPNCSGYPRPDEKYWNRVALELCDIDTTNIPDYPISSRLGSAGQGNIACGAYQAINRDYKGNFVLLGVNRGHLNPNSINYQDQEGQIGTFTLTNAAPQFSKFNQIAWKEYECMIKKLVMTYVPRERVYIITGTMGVAKDEEGNPIWMNKNSEDEKNPVKVPGFYWKAVCYPGNQYDKKSPWAFAILAENTKDSGVSSANDIMTAAKFSSMYFVDNLFGDTCLNADIGPIMNYLKDWESQVDQCT